MWSNLWKLHYSMRHDNLVCLTGTWLWWNGDQRLARTARRDYTIAPAESPLTESESFSYHSWYGTENYPLVDQPVLMKMWNTWQKWRWLNRHLNLEHSLRRVINYFRWIDLTRLQSSTNVDLTRLQSWTNVDLTRLQSWTTVDLTRLQSWTNAVNMPIKIKIIYKPLLACRYSNHKSYTFTII